MENNYQTNNCICDNTNNTLLFRDNSTHTHTHTLTHTHTHTRTHVHTGQNTRALWTCNTNASDINFNRITVFYKRHEATENKIKAETAI